MLVGATDGLVSVGGAVSLLTSTNNLSEPSKDKLCIHSIESP